MRQRKSQRWSGSGSGRGSSIQILIESADPALAVSDFGAFTAAGIDVALCRGPEHTADECPVVRGEPCALAAGADVILFDLGSPGGEVLDATRRVYSATPVVVRDGDAGNVPPGCVPLTESVSVDGQIAIIRRLADRR